MNIASRMESHGLPDAIQVTRAVYEQLAASYTFEDRGEIQVKGKERMSVWILTGTARQKAAGAV